MTTAPVPRTIALIQHRREMKLRRKRRDIRDNRRAVVHAYNNAPTYELRDMWVNVWHRLGEQEREAR